LNTFLLLTSSAFAAAAVERARRELPRRAALSLCATIACGVGFLVVKGLEYGEHLQQGFAAGASLYWSLYWVSTGLHTFHVAAGLCLLAFFAARLRGRAPPGPDGVECAVLYWHFVDLVWIFLWPLFYLRVGS